VYIPYKLVSLVRHAIKSLYTHCR